MTTDPMYNDAYLLLRAQSGDDTAFRQIYDRYFTTLYRIALSGTRSEADADDIVQECFLAFFQHVNDIEKTSNVGAWLYVTLRNRIIDYYAKQSVRSKHALEHRYTAVTAPDEIYSVLRVKEILECVKQTLENVPEKTREVYLLSREQQLTIGEIAELLGRSTQTVKNQLHTATTRIRQALKDQRLPGWIFFF